VKLTRSALIRLIKEETASLYSNGSEEETIFKEREFSHELTKTIQEFDRLLNIANGSVKNPTDMDTIEIQVGQIKNWKDVLVKFLMAIGG